MFKGRGRKLKCEEFPDLTGILEFPFGESDRVDRAGGGLESHVKTNGHHALQSSIQ